jgi:hypothetical protein
MSLLENYEYDEPNEFTNKEPFPKGEYPFRVLEINAVTQTKKTGADMIPIKLEFSNDAGETVDVYENLIFTEKAKWKIDSFLKAVWPKMEKGRKIAWLDDSFIDWLKKQKGRAVLKVEPVQGKDYFRNEVDHYIYGAEGSQAVKAQAPAPVLPSGPPAADDDNIPF